MAGLRGAWPCPAASVALTASTLAADAEYRGVGTLNARILQRIPDLDLGPDVNTGLNTVYLEYTGVDASPSLAPP